jgi:hypothetical protein
MVHLHLVLMHCIRRCKLITMMSTSMYAKEDQLVEAFNPAYLFVDESAQHVNVDAKVDAASKALHLHRITMRNKEEVIQRSLYFRFFSKDVHFIFEE